MKTVLTEAENGIIDEVAGSNVVFFRAMIRARGWVCCVTSAELSRISNSRARLLS